MSINEKYRKLCDEIKRISASAGRNADTIKIVAVTKTFPSHTIQEAIDQGLYLFGENKVQEAKQKIPELRGSFSFHLVGHLQSNKARDAVKLFDLIHSIDKTSTANKLDFEAKKINKVQKILVQVNTSGEDTKSGIEPENTIALFKEILIFQNIDILGLMTIGPLTEDKNRIRESFKILKNLLAEVNKELGININELSMGMSSDYPIAIEEGATMLRIGSAIFGERNYSQ